MAIFLKTNSGTKWAPEPLLSYTCEIAPATHEGKIWSSAAIPPQKDLLKEILLEITRKLA